MSGLTYIAVRFLRRRHVTFGLAAFMFGAASNAGAAAAGLNQDQQITVHYADFDIQSVPREATAYAGSEVVARAKAKFPTESGTFLEITETYYSASGSVVYEGTLLLKADFGRYIPVDEKTISGLRPFRAFRDWPSGR